MNIQPIYDNSADFGKVFLSSKDKTLQLTPHCKQHGAMNKVSVFKEGGGYWRCCTTDCTICKAGCIEIKT